MYKLNGENGVIRLEDNAYIPKDEGNSDYARYLKWIEEGNEPETSGETDLAAARAAKIQELNQARQAANNGSFTFQGKEIACDPLSRSDIDGVANHIGLTGAFPPGFPNAWKAKDNTIIPLANVQAFKDFYSAMAAQGSENFRHSEMLKAQLNNPATDTIEKIQAIVW